MLLLLMLLLLLLSIGLGKRTAYDAAITVESWLGRLRGCVFHAGLRRSCFARRRSAAWASGALQLRCRILRRVRIDTRSNRSITAAGSRTGGRVAT